ncbi:MAG: hypothetical protein NVS4B7_20450 [Ktedonobacteraceae bacterium]
MVGIVLLKTVVLQSVAESLFLEGTSVTLIAIHEIASMLL